MKSVLFATIPYSQLHQTDLKGSPEFGINILLDSATIDIAAVTDFVNHTGLDYMFSLSGVLLDQAVGDELFHTMYTLLTLSDGLGAGVTSIPLFDSAKEHNSKYVEALQTYFKLQGEHTVNFVPVQPGTNSIVNSILFCSHAHLITLTADQLTVYLTAGITRIVVWQDTSMLTLEASITAIERAKQNRFATLLFTETTRNGVSQRHQHQAALWQQRANLYLTFISLGKKISQGEYYGIKEWYNKEYEVLPLWYKRFGHIIKVFMGRRTLKSLFNDNN